MATNLQKQWRVTRTDRTCNELQLVDAPVPTLGENEVLVRIHAVSLNFRDLMILRGDYPFPLHLPVVPCSDGAGEVVAIGSKVKLWAKGDRVITLLSQAHLYGPATPVSMVSGLGGSLDGTLRQYGAFNEQGLVRAPRNLTYREASTLVCAGVTSWNALYGLKPLRPGQWVLILGTGGVSVFALQFSKAAGATVIATTSSQSKVEALKELGADFVINYKDEPAWGQKVKSFTPNGRGVDHIIEVGGVGTLSQSLGAIACEGVISCVGSVSGDISESGNLPTMLDCWLNNCIARGVAVGSRAQMEDMVAAIEANGVHPLVDERLFNLHEAKAAFEHYSRNANFGKTVIILD
ncbi:hypothetical protein N7510_008125 [Penicillium lagena]|uniref:uncharacterized protein n=1 Tax=Penicillium lagena TaxID=94218 RepID=UPI0025405786|nr:uncharacterized protein N7510_008125 [Penicillium lagena]KAJ5611406.1 hypothetical protein N7510_008125 [Penicillium lagena]